MMLFYIDEFGDHKMLPEPGEPTRLKRGQSEWFALSAVGIHDSTRKPLAEALLAVKERHFGDYVGLGDWGDTEIKGRYLYRASRSVAMVESWSLHWDTPSSIPSSTSQPLFTT